ncbi:MAG: hypothetical protein NC548_28480 [Lachnospiraceae bacterium]|nr:hypothetical protein [Lachnospiraceae bacterium]MCM1234115.1 hypothetical protein [Ruminococcus flavefaciens]
MTDEFEAMLIVAAILFSSLKCFVRYVVRSIGWMRILNSVGFESPGVVFIPFVGPYFIYWFLTQQCNDPSWEKWVLICRPVYTFIPGVGTILHGACGIADLILHIRWLNAISAGAFSYVVAVVFRSAVPFTVSRQFNLKESF